MTAAHDQTNRLTRWRHQRHERLILAAELELAEAKYRIDVWGFADSPKRRHEKEKRVERAQRRLNKLLAVSSVSATTETSER